MELELGLKITHTRDDQTSSTTDFRISKDPFGPLFCSKETDTMFILVIHLKGFKGENIEIEINKEGNRIAISGRKPVQEMVLVRWIMWKKEVELRVFRKVFRIPDVVDLDQIKAKFNEEDAKLTIKMPKKVKGISGLKIEEEKEEEVEDFEEIGVSEAAEATQEKPPGQQNENEVAEIERQESFDHHKQLEEWIPKEEGEKEIEPEKIEEKSKLETSEKYEEETLERHNEGEIEELEVETREEEETNEEMSEGEESIDVQKKIKEEITESEGEKEIEMEKREEDEPGRKETKLPEESKEPSSKVTTEDVNTKEEEEENDGELSADKPEIMKPFPIEETPRNEPEADQATEQTKSEKSDKEESYHSDNTASAEIQEPTEEVVSSGDEESEELQEEQQENGVKEGAEGRHRRCRRTQLCFPIVAGSALLMSLIVIVIHLIRSKQK